MVQRHCIGTDNSEPHEYEWHLANSTRTRCPEHAAEAEKAWKKAWSQSDPERNRAYQRKSSQTERGREYAKEKARQTSSRRWARKRGARVVDRNVSWRTVAARDGILCWLCDFPCDPCDYEMVNDGRTFVAGALYPTLDHVIPIAHGGEHSMANGKLAHKRCNLMKSDSIV